jgi:hypothetical protein
MIGGCVALLPCKTMNPSKVAGVHYSSKGKFLLRLEFIVDSSF